MAQRKFTNNNCITPYPFEHFAWKRDDTNTPSLTRVEAILLPSDEN